MIKKTLFLASMLLLFFACNNDNGILIKEETGEVTFSFSSNTVTGKLSAKNTDVNVSALYITIEDSEGNVVKDNEKITLTSFGSSYITDEIELSEGDYNITSFNIVDEDNSVVYASPLEGSDMAQYVNDPLPIAFSVVANESNTVTPEVIYVGPTTTPEQFGYTSFSFVIVDVPSTQNLFISVNETIDGVTSEVQGTYIVEIDAQDYISEGIIYFDHIAIEIPQTLPDDTIKVTVNYADYDSQVFYFVEADLFTFTETEPYEVYFENTTTTPTESTLYFNLYQYDEPEYYITSGAYTYTSSTGNYSGNGVINYGEETIQLPYLTDDETITIKFFHANYILPIEQTLTQDAIDVTATGSSLGIYFNEDQILKGTTDNRDFIYIRVFKLNAGGDYEYVPAFYDAWIGNLSFSQEGYLRSGNTNIIELPAETYNELDLKIYSGDSETWLNFTSREEVAAYNSDNPLIVYLD